MSIPVRLTEPALADLLAINDYYLLQVSDRVAANIIDSLEAAVNSLADLNERGSVPKELLVLVLSQSGYDGQFFKKTFVVSLSNHPSTSSDTVLNSIFQAKFGSKGWPDFKMAKLR